MPGNAQPPSTDRPRITLDDSGTRHVAAKDEAGLYWGMGFSHARDRGLQMLMMRILGRGEASEHLDASDRMLEVDIFFRRMNWRNKGGSPRSDLPEQAGRNCDAYSFTRV